MHDLHCLVARMLLQSFWYGVVVSLSPAQCQSQSQGLVQPASWCLDKFQADLATWIQGTGMWHDGFDWVWLAFHVCWFFVGISPLLWPDQLQLHMFQIGFKWGKATNKRCWAHDKIVRTTSDKIQMKGWWGDGRGVRWRDGCRCKWHVWWQHSGLAHFQPKLDILRAGHASVSERKREHLLCHGGLNRTPLYVFRLTVLCAIPLYTTVRFPNKNFTNVHKSCCTVPPFKSFACAHSKATATGSSNDIVEECGQTNLPIVRVRFQHSQTCMVKPQHLRRAQKNYWS